MKCHTFAFAHGQWGLMARICIHQENSLLPCVPVSLLRLRITLCFAPHSHSVQLVVPVERLMAQQGSRFGSRERIECRWRPFLRLNMVFIWVFNLLFLSSSFFAHTHTHLTMSTRISNRFLVWCCKLKRYLPPALIVTLCLRYADCERRLSKFSVKPF